MKKIVAGIIIMAVGAFLLFNNMGFVLPGVYPLIISWQTLLIAIGLILLFDKQQNHKSSGLVLVVIGTLFLLPKISPLYGSGFIIPIIFIAIGIGVIIKSATQKNEDGDHEKRGTWTIYNPDGNKQFTDFGNIETINGGGIVHKEYTFTGSKEKWTQGKLKNVFIEATFSGVEIDFTQAELADDIKVAAHIKVKSVFSGVILYVPEDWNITVQKTGAFGGFTDNRPNRVLKVAGDKLVILELEATFGGGEIRCYEYPVSEYVKTTLSVHRQLGNDNHCPIVDERLLFRDARRRKFVDENLGFRCMLCLASCVCSRFMAPHPVFRKSEKCTSVFVISLNTVFDFMHSVDGFKLLPD